MSMDDTKITAFLAMLEPLDREKTGAAFTQMLEYFSKMMEIDVDGLEPTTHALVKDNRVRPDNTNPSSQAKLTICLNNAPKVDDNFITIPGVL